MVPLIQQQSVLYRNDFDSIVRSLEAIANSAEIALRTNVISGLQVRYGDCSPYPSLTEAQLQFLKDTYSSISIEYEFFNENLGSAAGHNRLAQRTEADFLLIQNPDVIPSPRIYQNLLHPFNFPKVGMTEAKQLPIEHPKDYDQETGDTSWASTACALINRGIFQQLEGFDSDAFFLYCDDVDFSWRVRSLGFRVVFQPSAVVFHDKRLSIDAKWSPTDSERYYSAEASLLLTYKWSREDLTNEYLAIFENSGDVHQVKAAKEFYKKKDQNLLPKQLDETHEIGQFIDYNYAKHRYAL